LKIGELGAYDLVAAAPNVVPYVGTLTPMIGPAGGIGLDAEVYSCASEIIVKVADINLEGLESILVLVASSSDDFELVTLWQSHMGSGFFLGGFASEQGGAEPWDGRLQVNNGDSITAFYGDEDDGSGNGAVEADSAVIDCQTPVFEGLLSATVNGCSVTLDWLPADERYGLTRYNIYRDHTPGSGIGNLIGKTWMPSTTDSVCSSPEHTFCYVVRAVDASGNEDTNSVEACLTIYNTYMPLVLFPTGE
jgi:hypothetical protein